MSRRAGGRFNRGRVGSGLPTPAFDPSTLSLTGWWRASYASSPWNGILTRTLSEATNPPSTGTAINSLVPADFDGTNDELTATGTLDTYFNAGSGAGWALINLDAIANNNAAAYSNDGLFTTKTSAYACIGFKSNSGSPLAQFYLFHGADNQVQRAITTGSWTLVTFRWDGTNMGVGINEAPGAAGGAATKAFTTVDAAGLLLAVRVGGNYNLGVSMNGRVAEIGFSDVALSDANFVSIKSYINDRYGLSL